MQFNLKPLLAAYTICLSTFSTVYACPCSEKKHMHHGHHFKNDFKDKLSNRLNRKLDLTSEQKSKIDSILESKHKEAKAIFDEVHPRMEKIRKATDEEIKALLTSDQKVKFEKMLQEREEKHKKWEARHKEN